MALSMGSRKVGWHMVVEPDGGLDFGTVGLLRDELTGLIRRGHVHLVVNLQEVTFMDSGVLGVLVGTAKRVRNEDGSLEVVCQKPWQRRVFFITGMEKVLGILDDLDDLGGSLGARR